MIDLPRHLSPWGPQLALFPEEMALALGATVSRLSNLLGSSQLVQAAVGDPDGYDGIARRGSYERLLPAEWLMLDEVPEEFLRRVVAGEHTFLRRAHAHGAAGRRCVVLFDTGIDQLGAPRIAHLAVLILLARRAGEQGAALEWGTLQDPDLSLHTGLTEASVLDLLRARCGRSVSSGDIDRWAESLQGLRRSELWLVGAESLEREATKLRASVITASDLIEPGLPQRIRVRVLVSQVDRVREAVLDVPSERLAVQLLRDPFAAAVASRVVTATQIQAQSTMVFSPDARRLYVRGTASTLIAFQVPNSPRATPGPPVAFSVPDDHLIIAVGRSASRKRTVVLSQRGPELFLHRLSRRGATIAHSDRFAPSDGYTLPVHSSDVLRPLGVLECDRFCFIDGRGDLVELFEGRALHKDNASATASRALRDCFGWATLHLGVPRILWARTASSGEIVVSQATMPDDMPAIHGAQSFRFGEGLSELYAYATSPASWVIVDHGQCIPVGVPDRFSVLGVVERGYDPREVALVALDDTETRIELLLPGRSETLLVTGAPVSGVEVSGTGKEIAFVTSAGEVGVYSCVVGAIVVRTSGWVAP